MKVVVIADNLGNNAPGVVFRNILSGISGKIEIDIVTSTMDYQIPFNHRGLVKYVPQKRIPSWRIRTWLFDIFGFYHTQRNWARGIQDILDSGAYDVVISLMSHTFYASLMAADLYVAKRDVKHICYCVDAVPPPPPWEKRGMYSYAMKRCIKRYMQRVDVLCMTNQEMLAHELGIIGNPKIKSVVLPNPPKETSFQVLPFDDITPSFAYAGKMYGPRNPDALLNGFRLFMKKYPLAKFFFVGSGKLDIYIKKHYSDLLGNIEFISYSADLSHIFSKCVALIDVNANIDNDIFLSSKVIGYLPYNRLIISESGNGSPVRSLFKNSKTVIHVHHNPEDYLDAMEFCLNNTMTINYSEREEYLKHMDVNAVTETLVKLIYDNNEN